MERRGCGLHLHRRPRLPPPETVNTRCTTLCNFAARIVADVATDDGAESRRRVRLVGRLHTGEELAEVEVPVEKFAGMDWPMTEWGTRAIVTAGAGAKEHLRAAIMTLSGD